MSTSTKIILSLLTVAIMFGLFKKLFVQGSNNENLAQLISNGAFLVDVRSPQEFAQWSVKGAVNIPLDKIQSQLAKFKGKKTIITFCKSGGRSSKAKTILNQNGFKNVTNGGTWQNVNQFINN